MTKTLSIIEKKRIPEPAPIQNMTPIVCHDVRLVEKDFHYGSPSKSRKAAQLLGYAAYKLAVILEVERHINKGLHKALHLEKSWRQQEKRLNLLGEEAGGLVFFSPSKVQKAREIQQQKEANNQLKRDQ